MSKLGRLYYTLTEQIKMPKEIIMTLKTDNLIFMEKLFHYLDEDLYPYNDNIVFIFEETHIIIDVYQKCHKYSYCVSYADMNKYKTVQELVRSRLCAVSYREDDNEKEGK